MPTKRQKPAWNYDLLPQHGLRLKSNKCSMIKLSVLRNTQRLKFIVCDQFIRQSDRKTRGATSDHSSWRTFHKSWSVVQMCSVNQVYKLQSDGSLNTFLDISGYHSNECGYSLITLLESLKSCIINLV